MSASVSVTDWQWVHEDGAVATAPLSFTLAPGDRVLLSGRSGAGKSTLLAALAGVANSGRSLGAILIDGVAPDRARGAVGIVLQDPYAQAVMERVGDDIAFGLENFGVDPVEMPRRIRDALSSVDLDLSLEHPTDALSGGERQRLAIAGVLALAPKLLLLDEPTANLDPAGARHVRDSVSRIVRDQGLTLVVVDHNPELWSEVVSRELVLNADGITEQKPAAPSVPAPEPARAHTSSARAGALALSARALSVGYPTGSVAQRNLTFDVRTGSILAITGANGVGKSALALTLGGLIAPRAGEVVIHGDRVPAGPHHLWRARELAHHIGSVFQSPESQFIGPTVEADVAVGLTKAELNGELVAATLDEFRLAHLRSQNPFTLSGGEKRRLSIADVVVKRPRVMIFDEPTFGQDPESWADLVQSFRALRDAGHALVVVTHDEPFVATLADELLELVA